MQTPALDDREAFPIIDLPNLYIVKTRVVNFHSFLVDQFPHFIQSVLTTSALWPLGLWPATSSTHLNTSPQYCVAGVTRGTPETSS